VLPKNPTVGNQAAPTEKVDVNTGFFVAYDISYAVDAIHKTPIGALRAAQ
jgi:hypothetical protein